MTKVKNFSYLLLPVSVFSFFSSMLVFNWVVGKWNRKGEGRQKGLILPGKTPTTLWECEPAEPANTLILTLWLNYTLFTLAADTAALPQQLKIFAKPLNALLIRINWNISVSVGAWLNSWPTLEEYSVIWMEGVCLPVEHKSSALVFFCQF